MLNTLFLRSLLSLLLSVFFFTPVSPFAHSSFEIRDLETDFALFTAEAQSWRIINNLGLTTTSDCEGTSIFGGYGLVGQGSKIERVYTDLGSHNVIQFSIEFWVIDFVEDLNLFEIYFDNQLVGKWDSFDDNFDYLDTQSSCGGSNPDYSITVKGSVPHSDDQITIRVVSLASSANSFSIGIRDVSLLLKTSGTTPTLSICKFVSYTGSTQSCLCPDGYYDRPGALWCRKCNTACSSCFGSGSDDCTACAKDYFFDGSSCSKCDSSCATCSGPAANQCTSCNPDIFLNWDGTCQSSCPLPLVSTEATQQLYDICSLPCGTSKYYYQNKTCQDGCDIAAFDRYNDGAILYCDFKCTDDDEYLYLNGTCTDNCASPYTEVEQGVERYCRGPCETGEFFYKNETCESDCDYPFIQWPSGDDLTYCVFKCPEGEHLYNNDTCLEACDSPYTIISQGLEKYCKPPCEAGSGSFYYENYTCIAGCDAVNFIQTTVGDMDYCTFKCAQGSYLFENGTCSDSTLNPCASPYVQVTKGTERDCHKPCEAGSFLYENNTCQSDCDAPFYEWYSGDDLMRCVFQCPQDSYLFENGTCSDATTPCDFPYLQVTQGTERYCHKPCEAGSFLYENNTCQSDCDAPFYEWYSGNDLMRCIFQCGDDSYLFNNGTCSDVATPCDSPYLQVTQGTERYCHKPCEAGSFLYENNTCQSACDAPFYEWYSGDDLTRCIFQCPEDSYLFNNGTCSDATTPCSIPYIQVTQGTERYCKPPCETGNFYYQNDTCQPACDAPFYEFYSGDDLTYCNFQCDDNSYLFDNGTCSEATTIPCSPLYMQITQGTERYCRPYCEAGAFQYENNTCQTTCDAPFYEWYSGNDLLQCIFQCPEDSYLFNNGTCSDAMTPCSSPYIQITQGTERYCKPPCESGSFYYQNNTCQANCDLPFYKFYSGNDLTYCNFACSGSDFLYINGSCLTNCELPYIKILRGVESYCQPPCEANNFYYPQNQTCQTTCDYPFVQWYSGDDLKYCTFKCIETDYLYIGNDTCLATCDAPHTELLQGIEKYCNGPCATGSSYYPQNDTCIAGCGPFFIQSTVGDMQYCTFKCIDGYFAYPNETCTNNCVYPYTEVTQGLERYCKPPCAAGTFYNPKNQSCQSTCNLPAFNQWYAGNDLIYCTWNCPENTLMYHNGTCMAQCNYPYEKVHKGLEAYCESPCGINQYFYENETCKSSCPTHFNKWFSGNDLQYCNFPCPDVKFYDWNGNCRYTCGLPYIQRVYGVERYCQLPCGNNWYYLNNTCKSTCVYPFEKVTVYNTKNCYFKCEFGTYLYDNDTCLDGCSYPYIEVIQGLEKYCHDPCDTHGHFFYSNTTCQSNCPAPFIEDDSQNYLTCNFPCKTGEFWTWDHVCQDDCELPFRQEIKGVERYCASPCLLVDYLYQNATCQSGCAKNFFEVDVRHIKYCNFTCSDNKFLYWNQSCYDTCDLPLISIRTGVESYCQLPCGEGEFYYKNTTCSENCSYPYVQHNITELYTCDKPCADGEFLYWNGSCIASCPITFQEDVDGVMTCNFYCENGLYHYSNDTCFEICEAPLVTEEDLLVADYYYCNLPCSEGEYLYLNGSCFSDCAYKITFDASNNVTNCTFPCDLSKWYYQNNTCKSSCPSPYNRSKTVDEVLLCDSPCIPDEFWRRESGLCVAHCNLPLTVREEGTLTICENLPNPNDDPNSNSTLWTSLADQLEKLIDSFGALATAANAASGFIRPNDQNSVFMISLAKSAKHVSFIDLSVYNGGDSSRRRMLVETGDSSGFAISKAFTFKMPSALKEKFTVENLPDALQGKVKHTSFLVNFWEALTSFMSLAFLGVFSIICEFIAKKTKKPAMLSITRRLRGIAEWNFLLFAFFNSFDDITFFTIIELKTLHLNSAAAVFSFLICLAVCGVAGYMIYKVYKITRESLRIYKLIVDANNNNNSMTKQEDEFYRKYAKYQSLFYGYQSSSFLKQGFLLIFVGRIIFCYILIASCYSSPIAQTVILTICNILMLVYLIKERPTYDRFHLVVIIIFEVLGFIVNMCMLILASMIAQGSTNMVAENNLVKAISLITLMNDLLASLVLWGYVIIAIYNAVKRYKEKGIDAKTLWLNVFVAPYQPPGMELYEEEDTAASDSGDTEKGAMIRKPRRRIRPSRRRTLLRVKPLISSLNTKKRNEQQTGTSSDDMMTSGRKAILEKDSASNLHTFIRMESEVMMSAFKTDVEFEYIPHFSGPLSPLSPVSTDAIMSPNLSPSHSPQRSPKRFALVSPDPSSAKRKRSGNKIKVSNFALEKPLPSVIMEESTPCNNNGENETPIHKASELTGKQIGQQGAVQLQQANNIEIESPIQKKSVRKASEHIGQQPAVQLQQTNNTETESPGQKRCVRKASEQIGQIAQQQQYGPNYVEVDPPLQKKSVRKASEHQQLLGQQTGPSQSITEKNVGQQQQQAKTQAAIQVSQVPVQQLDQETKPQEIGQKEVVLVKAVDFAASEANQPQLKENIPTRIERPQKKKLTIEIPANNFTKEQQQQSRPTNSGTGEQSAGEVLHNHSPKIKESARSSEKKAETLEVPSTRRTNHRAAVEQTAEVVVNLNQVKETVRPEKKTVTLEVEEEKTNDNTDSQDMQMQRQKQDKDFTEMVQAWKKGTIKEEEESVDSPSVFIGYDSHVTTEEKKIKHSSKHFTRLNKKGLTGTRLKVVDQDDIPEIVITDSFEDLEVRLDG